MTQKRNYLQQKNHERIVFGGLTNLRKVSYLSNDKVKNEQELSEYQAKYQSNRMFPICSIGEAPQKSNRKFTFKIENRYLAVDLNPQYIGFSIVETDEKKDKFEIIYD